MTIKKIKSLVIVLIIAALSVWHAIWFINYFAYQNYSEGYIEAVGNLAKVTEDNSHTFSIARPKYPSFIGNFALSNENISVIIWPGLFANSNKEYGLRIYDDQADHTYGFYVNEEFAYLEEENMVLAEDQEKILTLMRKYKNELDEMKYMIEEEWKI